MIDIKFLRENPDIVKQNIKNKFQDSKLPLVDEVIELDKQSRAAKSEADALRASRNKNSKMIGALMAQGKKDEAEAAKAASQAKLEAAQARNAEAAKTNSALAAENEALKGELGNTSAVVNNILSTPACVFFEIGETRLSVKEAAHLDYIVKNVIAQGKELTFTVTGYTDKNTGSCARNRKLAKKRANYIKKMLVKRYGLTSDQFVVDYKPCTNVFTPIELNRAVIISAK